MVNYQKVLGAVGLSVKHFAYAVVAVAPIQPCCYPCEALMLSQLMPLSYSLVIAMSTIIAVYKLVNRGKTYPDISYVTIRLC